MEERWVVIKKVQGLTEAHIIKGLLEANGIPVKLQYETAAKLFGITLNGIGEVAIAVPEGYEKACERLIATSNRNLQIL